jgi:FAD/FMN-containing dehydrogenase
MAAVTQPFEFIQTRRRQRLAASLQGNILIPEHAAYDNARAAWSLSVDQRPAAVVFPKSAQMWRPSAVRPRTRAPRCGAGNRVHAGPLGSLEDTVLIKTERMRGVEIDRRARVARVEAGVLWQ